MQFDNRIIKAYIEDRAISKEVMYPYIKGYQKPDNMRKEVVEALSQQLEYIVECYPTFNPNICNALFGNQDEFIDSICICPIVGSTTLYYCETIQSKLYIYVLI